MVAKHSPYSYTITLNPIKSALGRPSRARGSPDNPPNGQGGLQMNKGWPGGLQMGKEWEPCKSTGMDKGWGPPALHGTGRSSDGKCTGNKVEDPQTFQMDRAVSKRRKARGPSKWRHQMDKGWGLPNPPNGQGGIQRGPTLQMVRAVSKWRRVGGPQPSKWTGRSCIGLG